MNATAPARSKLLTASEAAARLGISREAVLRLQRAGALPGIRYSSRAWWHFREDAVEALLSRAGEEHT